MTVHLIAKMGGQQSSTSGNTTSQPNTQNQQQTGDSATTGNTQGNTTQGTQPQQFANPFGGLMSMMGGAIGGPHTATMTFTNMNDLNQNLGGILGSLGIRLPPTGANGVNTQQGGSNQPGLNPTANTHNPLNNPFQTPPTNRPQ